MSAIDRLLDIVYPRRAVCAGCGDRSGMARDWLCEDCRQALAGRWVGAMPPPAGGMIDEAVAAYYYGGPASGMVRSLKYGGAWKLAEPMGRHMVRALEIIRPVPADCVAPVPMHRKRLGERGFNHAALLAKVVAGALSLPLMDALERVRDTPQQARLDDEKRRENMLGAFAVKADVAGRRVLLVDDVLTTGATANACAQALRDSGAAGVIGAFFAVAGKERH